MKASEIRRRYLEFFQQRGHKVFPSASLVPEGDSSVLFTGAGMNQFKDSFLGKGPAELRRAASSQKCIRMPDLDNVGRTRSHHTFFEMLGNFSFGDYFKEDAITWAMEFLEGELSLPRESLAISVYLDDDEAAGIWENVIGIPRERIWRYGEEDNFWPAEAPSKGPNGPCGPCSEIYFDFSPSASAGSGKQADPASDSDRFVEIWNLVFTQYDRKGENTLEPLPRKNIDTGAGLERLARVMQGKENNFETDLFVPLIDRIGELTERKYGIDADVDVRMKRISDHIRAAVFCISDGVRPSNEGRGYVVRKVIRRAAMDLKELGMNRPGLSKVVPTITQVMEESYPVVKEIEAIACDTINTEEERFLEVYRLGAEKLAQMLDETTGEELEGKKAFFLWDTAGLPLDITKRYCEERGYSVDEKSFDEEMSAQRDRARAGSKIAGEIFGTGKASALKGEVDRSSFVGYEVLSDESSVVALLDDQGSSTGEVNSSQAFNVVLDRTPFYGEGGGQVGDRGALEWDGGRCDVVDTSKADEYVLHQVERLEGTLSVGDRVRARVDVDRRKDIMRNHTATHLLHWALKRVLGDGATQAGSLVHPDYLRFDYHAKDAPGEDRLLEIENLVNDQVLRDVVVSTSEMAIGEAKKVGAVAMFGEKYGDQVRVVSVTDEELGPDFSSVELCGGTHCARTGQIGLFKIISDSAIAAGIRRIVSYTGSGALRWAQQKDRTSRGVAGLLKTSEGEVLTRLKGMLSEQSRLKKDIARSRRSAAVSSVDSILEKGRPVGEITLFSERVDGVGQEDLRSLADRIVKANPESVVVLVGVDSEKVLIVTASGPPAIKRGIRAGDLCRDLGQALGGGGGGRPDMAQGQGSDVAGVDAALKTTEVAIEKALS